MPGSGYWCVLQDDALFAGAVRVYDTVNSRTMLSNKWSWKYNAKDISNTFLTLCVKAFSCKEGQATSLTTIQYYGSGFLSEESSNVLFVGNSGQRVAKHWCMSDRGSSPIIH